MILRTTVLALALSVGFMTPAHANPAAAWELCKAVGRYVSEIGEARDKGLPRAAALEVAATSPVSLSARLWKHGTILYAYDKPHVTPSELFFIGALACMDKSMADLAAARVPAKKLRR